MKGESSVSSVYETILHMSIVSGYSIVIVLLLRLLFRRFPKRYSYALWLVVFFRLVCPLQFEGSFSLIPGILTEQQGEWMNREPEESGNENPYTALNDLMPEADAQKAMISGASDRNAEPSGEDKEAAGKVFAENVTGNDGEKAGALIKFSSTKDTHVNSSVQNEKRETMWQSLPGIIWLLGVVGIWSTEIILLLRFRRNQAGAVEVEPGVYEQKNTTASFVLGILHPAVYLPAGLDDKSRTFILCHEKIHIRRRDYLLKPLALLIAGLHWFNPLVWLAYYLMVQDMEMSCDERVVELLGEEQKKDYSYLLLKMAVGRQNGCITAFAEQEVKKRIKNVLRYRRLKVWGMALLILLVTGVTVGLATNAAPGRDELPADTEGMQDVTSGEPADTEGTQDITKGQLSDAEGASPDQIKTSFYRTLSENYAECFQMSESEVREWYERFLADGVKIDDQTRLNGFFYGDLDGDREADVFFTTEQHDPVWCAEVYGYLGGRQCYYLRCDETLYGIEASSGDINRDGRLEIAYIMNTGGCGGSGSWWKGLLQYQDGKLVELPVPGADAYALSGEAGYTVNIYMTEEPQLYRAQMEEADDTAGKTCFFKTDDSIEDTLVYFSPDSYKEGEHVPEFTMDQVIGASNRGFDRFEIISRDGRDYLQATQYLCAGSPVNGIGSAVFLFDWDDAGNPYVQDFSVDGN